MPMKEAQMGEGILRKEGRGKREIVKIDNKRCVYRENNKG